MALYSPSTRFFINAWTWGYEDLYKAVAKAFRAKVSYKIHFTERGNSLTMLTDTCGPLQAFSLFSLITRPFLEVGHHKRRGLHTLPCLREIRSL